MELCFTFLMPPSYQWMNVCAKFLKWTQTPKQSLKIKLSKTLWTVEKLLNLFVKVRMENFCNNCFFSYFWRILSKFSSYFESRNYPSIVRRDFDKWCVVGYFHGGYKSQQNKLYGNMTISFENSILLLNG